MTAETGAECVCVCVSECLCGCALCVCVHVCVPIWFFHLSGDLLHFVFSLDLMGIKGKK